MSEPDFDDPSGRLPLLNEPAISASPSLTQTPTRRGAIAILAVVMVATAFASLLSGSTPRLMFYGATASQRGTHQLALISIDGFRFDYIDRRWRAASVNESQYGNEGRARKHGAFIAPNLRHLAGKGCFSSMQPVFPSKTFPNHNSIATGLFPAYSGIVGNTMYNRETGKWFHVSMNSPEWWKGEPIWVTLTRAAKKTASVFWPGSDVAGRLPDAFWAYNGSVSYSTRVDRVIALLNGSAHDMNGHNADFVTLYFEAVDHAGHRHGPNSVEVDEAIGIVDDAIGELSRRAPELSFVIVSDHGMAQTSSERTIDLNPAVPPESAMSIVVSPVLMLVNKTFPATKLVKEVEKVANAHARVWLKEDLPERWHLRDSPLVPEVVGVADIEWTLQLTNVLPGRPNSPDMSIGRAADLKPANHPVHGDHGFDNEEPQMQALFLLSGPAFRTGVEIHGMRAVDVYPLIAEVFGVKHPAPHNGSLATTVRAIRTRL